MTNMPEFDTQRNSKGLYRWVYDSPGGAEFVGATWHKTRKAAIEAGQNWLAARQGGTHEGEGEGW